MLTYLAAVIPTLQLAFERLVMGDNPEVVKMEIERSKSMSSLGITLGRSSVGSSSNLAERSSMPPAAGPLAPPAASGSSGQPSKSSSSSKEGKGCCQVM